MNTPPSFLPIKTPIKQSDRVMANILKQTGKIDILKNAKLTPTAKASMLVAIESIKTTIQTNLEEKYWPNIIKVESTLPRTQVGKVDYKKIEEETKELSLTIGIEEKLNVINELESKKNKIKQRVKQCREK